MLTTLPDGDPDPRDDGRCRCPPSIVFERGRQETDGGAKASGGVAPGCPARSMPGSVSTSRVDGRVLALCLLRKDEDEGDSEGGGKEEGDKPDDVGYCCLRASVGILTFTSTRSPFSSCPRACMGVGLSNGGSYMRMLWRASF